MVSLTSFPPLDWQTEGSMETLNPNTDNRGAGGEPLEQGECQSQPPSPPESGAATPSLRIGPCPARLAPIIPPLNYGAVEHSNIFRSAFPQERNLDFLRILGVRSVLCLVNSTPTPGYRKWIAQGDIKHHQLYIEPNKEGKVKTTWDSLCQAVLWVMDPDNQPVYIHCNQGRHRTGCVVACLRKVQRWPIEDILTEYETYAIPKSRSGDVELIRDFDPEAVYQYSKKHEYFHGRRFMRRSDSVISNIDTLVAALCHLPPSEDSASSDVAMVSQSSSLSGDDVANDNVLLAPMDGHETQELNHALLEDRYSTGLGINHADVEVESS